MKKMKKRVLSLILTAIISAASVQWDTFAVENSVPVEAASEELPFSESKQSTDEIEYIAEETTEQENLSDAQLDALDSVQYAEWKQAYMQSSHMQDMPQGRASGTSGGDYIRNDIIEAVVDYSGKYTIGTVNGSDLSTDNHKILLFGHPVPWSSFTTVRVDGADHEFCGTTNRVATADAVMVSQMINNVVTTQSLEIVANEYTGKEDTIAITYTMTNYDTVDHNVGLRIMMDTMLGDNDGAPFRVPGYGNVTKELEFSGSDIPQNWLSFDRLDNPRVIANGCFYQTLDEKPDKVQFASWRGIERTLWSYSVNASTSVTGDSAVAAYYNPQVLAPGESRTVTTYYGIGDFAVTESKPPLSTRVIAPVKLVEDNEEGGYSHNPFSVTAYIQNTGVASAVNVKAQLKLPADGCLQLISPANPIQTIGNIPPGEEIGITWLVYAKEQTTKKKAEYSIIVSADNESAKTVHMSTTLPKTKALNDNFTIKLNKNEVSLDVDGTYYTQLKVTCSDRKERNVTWLSTNPAIASVDSKGYVKAISGGKASIVAAVGSKNAVCEVTVNGTSNPLQKLELSENTVQMQIGQVRQLVARYTPVNVSQKGVKWTSSNSAVVKVNENGRLEAVANGNAQIRAAYNADSSKYAVCDVQVGTDPQNVKLNQTLNVNETLYGPEISILNKTFNLFKVPISTEIKFNEAIALEYDPEDKSLTGTFGLLGDGTLFDSGEYQNDYKKIKKAGELLKKQGPKKFIKNYGSVLKNKKTAPAFFQKGEISTFGGVKFQQVNGSYQFAEGEVYVVISWPKIFEIKYNLPACPVIYFKFNISGELKGGLKLEAQELGWGSNQTFKLDGTVGGSLSLSGGVGADILVAGLEGGLKGTLSIDLEHILGFNAQQDMLIKLSGSLYAKAKMLFFIEFNNSWEFASAQLYPKVSKNAEALRAVSLDDENFVPMNPYVDSLHIAEHSSQGEYILANNGYAYNEPVMIRLSDGRIFAVWADNVNGRNEYNRTGIYYAVFDGGAWSEPELVDDDGTADFSPVAATDGQNVYIAWQDMDKAFDDAVVSLNDMLPHTGIKLACFDGMQVKAAVRITKDNDNYDSIPRIAAAD